MIFEFATAARIIFGAGKIAEVTPHVAALGQRALVVTFRTVERAAPLLERLDDAKLEYAVYSVPGEPTIDMMTEAVQLVRDAGCDVVVSFGGGSALDAGKAIAALATNPGEPLDYLEVIGRGQPLQNDPLPFIAIPTTAGTGAEVTKNAVLASKAHRVKVSLRHPLMLPRLAVIDPELTYSLPPDVTAATGMDALTQVVEPFVTHLANPMTDAFCREGIKRAGRSLRRAYENGLDADAREDMALASLFGGLALANAKLGAVHGFAGVLGGMFDAPHGAVCAALLPHVMETNIRALQTRQPEGIALRRYDEIAGILTGNANAKQGAAWVAALRADLKIPALGDFGIQKADFTTIIDRSRNSSSMKGNPLPLTDEEMHTILENALA